MKQSMRAFTLIELLVVISIIALLVGILLPAIGKSRDSAKVMVSMTNLRNFGAAHATYASEWNGRQWTTSPDDMSMIIGLGNAYTEFYPASGNTPTGRDWAEIPSVPLGFTRSGQHMSTRGHAYIVPMWAPGNCSRGDFRAFHTKPFNQYINKKVYDSIFWAPKDYTIDEIIHQWQEDPGEYPEGSPPLYFSTYCMSVAAQVSPDVYRGPSAGDAQRARDLPAGHRTPNLSSATYPDLKTHMLEHYWLQNNPSESIPGTAGVPWFFNMGPDSTPSTLFFDSSVRMMSVREAVSSSRRVVTQGEDELDANDPACFGTGGYFQSYGYAGANTRGEINSYHVFTRDGIKGRDTTGSP
jgi:prepilin-type N-terminal cleavage/methylation domain-containing protein